MRDREVYFAEQRAKIKKVHLVAREIFRDPPSDYDVMTWPLPDTSYSQFKKCAEFLVHQRTRSQRWKRPPVKTDRSSFVYFIRGGDCIKIGTSHNVTRRLADLQAASPLPLTVMLVIPGSMDLEKALHRQYAKLRSHGEWFRAEEPLVSHIPKVVARYARKQAAA